VNYRHAFHAGNFADVFKHAVLAGLLESLRRKDTPFCVIDVHAGIGRYDLLGDAALRTGEAQAGVLRLVGQTLPPAMSDYWRAVMAVNPPGVDGLRFYPGSPRIARHLLRPQDRLLLVELHPDDARALSDEFARDPQVHVRAMDAYTALKALLPPAERRGLVLIDPPFEVKDEFAQIQKGLADAWRRWPTGMYAIWYPIKALAPVRAFHRWLRDNAPGPALAAELYVHPATTDERLNGCGLVVVRPPWKFAEQLDTLLPFLGAALQQSTGKTEVHWLKQE
jgi:23S rRNA (adenine2030-N6)-methyltransferase